MPVNGALICKVCNGWLDLHSNQIDTHVRVGGHSAACVHPLRVLLSLFQSQVFLLLFLRTLWFGICRHLPFMESSFDCTCSHWSSYTSSSSFLLVFLPPALFVVCSCYPPPPSSRFMVQLSNYGNLFNFYFALDHRNPWQLGLVNGLRTTSLLCGLHTNCLT